MREWPSSATREILRSWRTALFIPLVSMLLAAAVVGSAAGASGYVSFPQDDVLARSRTYTVEGKRTRAGCEFREEELRLPSGWTAIERRDIAINFDDCTKTVEEGEPSAEPALGDVLAEDSGDDIGTQSLTLWKRGYHLVWYEDVAGLVVVSAEANIRWFYSGGCVLSGSGQAVMTGAGWSGWQAVSLSYSDNLSCVRYLGTTVGSAKNASFCSPVTVWAYFYFVKARGYADGTIIGTNSTDVVNECLPLSKHQRVKITASGSVGA